MLLGKGAMHNKSIKQKLNTQSSKEAEIFGICDYMPGILCSMQLLEYQG